MTFGLLRTLTHVAALLAAAVALLSAPVLLALACRAQGRAASAGTGRAHAELPAGGLDAVARGWWEVEYEDPVAGRRFRTANELHLPVGRTIELTLTSTDVIHRSWVPSLHGKRDLVPGRRTRLTLKVDRPGTFRGRCAELCGRRQCRGPGLVTPVRPVLALAVVALATPRAALHPCARC